MSKNKQLNLIASGKMPNIGFFNKYIINSGIRGGYYVLVNYQSLLSNIFPLAHSLNYFFIKYRRNRLIRESVTEQQDFMIYQHVNKRATVLSLATSHIAH